MLKSGFFAAGVGVRALCRTVQCELKFCRVLLEFVNSGPFLLNLLCIFGEIQAAQLGYIARCFCGSVAGYSDSCTVDCVAALMVVMFSPWWAAALSLKSLCSSFPFFNLARNSK